MRSRRFSWAWGSSSSTWPSVLDHSAILHLGVLALLFPLVGLGFFILWLYMIFSAYQGKTVVLPIIGPLAQQQK